MVLLTVHNDIHGAKRMRKLTQRKAVDYTSTVVRYMQVMITALIIESQLSWKSPSAYIPPWKFMANLNLPSDSHVAA
jgi:polyadenylation factor subunit 2